MIGHCKLRVSVAKMEEPCLLGLHSLFRNAACDDLGRMQRQVYGGVVPLVLEGASKQVESPVTSPDVEEKRLELNCGVMREHEVADATEEACGGHAVESCGGEVKGNAGKAGPMGSARSEAGQQPCREAGRNSRWKVLLPRLWWSSGRHCADRTVCGRGARRMQHRSTCGCWLIYSPYRLSSWRRRMFVFLVGT